MAIGHQSFYQTQLTSAISDTDLIIPLDTVPTVSEGFLVIESTVEAKREIIYYTSKDASSVTCPSGAGNGRGYDGTTAVSHLQGATVIMAPVGVMFDKLGDISVNSITIGSTTSAEGWSPLGATPNTVTANGNKSYSLVFNGTDLTDTITEGMRVRTARTVVAPNKSTSLNGTTQYYSKTSPNKMTFTDDFVVSAWVKLSSYAAAGTVISRYNGTSGWAMDIASGQVRLGGFNAGAGNVRYVTSYQAIPLNKWVHLAAQLDMSSGTATTTTNYVMMDGVDVPVFLSSFGTAPTALIQAGDVQVGALNGINFFPGKIAQVAVYSAKVTQATILASMNQGLIGTETSLASAYSFNNSITDLNTTTPNDLTANGSAVATNADSPFGNSGVSTTIDYGIVMAKSFSTNTTLTVQVPEGCTIPTTGGIASMDYSIQAVPYGFPKDKGKWRVEANLLVDQSVSTPVSGTKYNISSFQIKVPAGAYWVGGEGVVYGSIGSGSISIEASVSTSSSTFDTSYTHLEAQATAFGGLINTSRFVSPAVSTIYYLIASVSGTSPSAIYYFGGRGGVKLFADNALL